MQLAWSTACTVSAYLYYVHGYSVLKEQGLTLLKIEFCLGSFRSAVRDISFDFMLVVLMALHNLDEHPAINASFRVSVGNHVTGITPLNGFYKSQL